MLTHFKKSHLTVVPKSVPSSPHDKISRSRIAELCRRVLIGASLLLLLSASPIHARPILTCYTEDVPLPAPQDGNELRDWYSEYESKMSGVSFSFGRDPIHGGVTDCWGIDFVKGRDLICATPNGPKSDSFWIDGGQEWITEENNVFEAFRSDGLYYRLEMKEPYQLFRKWHDERTLFTTCLEE